MQCTVVLAGRRIRPLHSFPQPRKRGRGDFPCRIAQIERNCSSPGAETATARVSRASGAGLKIRYRRPSDKVPQHGFAGDIGKLVSAVSDQLSPLSPLKAMRAKGRSFQPLRNTKATWLPSTRSPPSPQAPAPARLRNFNDPPAVDPFAVADGDSRKRLISDATDSGQQIIAGRGLLRPRHRPEGFRNHHTGKLPGGAVRRQGHQHRPKPRISTVAGNAVPGLRNQRVQSASARKKHAVTAGKAAGQRRGNPFGGPP